MLHIYLFMFDLIVNYMLFFKVCLVDYNAALN